MVFKMFWEILHLVDLMLFIKCYVNGKWSLSPFT